MSKFTITSFFLFMLCAALTATHMRDYRDETEGVFAASVMGVTVGVGANQYNTVAAQLEQKEQELAKREQELFLLQQAASGDRAQYALIATAASFVLLLINFYLDYRRAHGTAATA